MLPRMSLISEAWVFLNRLQRRIRRPPTDEGWAPRHQFIDQYAPGRSFADIGGLFQLHGEVALRAHRAGATQVTVFDCGDESYGGFAERRREAGPTVRFVQGDLEEGRSLERIGSHDIVWCTGVIYHTPNPVLQLMHLRAITRELLYLGTHTIPEIPGFAQACIYYPYLPARERRVHARPHWDADKLYAVGTPFDDVPMRGYGNFWWGLTPSALRAMLASARFEVVEEIRQPDYPWLLDVICRPIEQLPVLPPRSYFRQRGERRDGGEPELPWLSPPEAEGWWS
jgi:hypothetical protein